MSGHSERSEESEADIPRKTLGMTDERRASGITVCWLLATFYLLPITYYVFYSNCLSRLMPVIS